jgi:hypothetical protein
VQYVDCTPEEFKALLDLREKSLGPDAKDHLSVSREIELEQAREVLGEERGRDYERLTDGGYRNGRQAAARAGLSDDLADQIGQIVYEARMAILRLAKETSVPIDERIGRAQTVKAEAAMQVSSLCGGQLKPGILATVRGTLDNTAESLHP